MPFKHCRRFGMVWGLNLQSPFSHFCEMPHVEREPSLFLQNRTPTPSSGLRFLNTFILCRILIVPISPIWGPLNAIRRFKFARSWASILPCQTIRSGRTHGRLFAQNVNARFVVRDHESIKTSKGSNKCTSIWSFKVVPDFPSCW